MLWLFLAFENLDSSEFWAEDRLHQAFEVLRHLVVNVKARLLSFLELHLVDVSEGVSDDGGDKVIGNVGGLCK